MAPNRGGLDAVVLGGSTGALSAVLLQPLDVIKTQMQIAPSRVGVGACMVQVYRKSGPFGFWRGLSPSLVRTVPGAGLYFGLVHNLQLALGAKDTSRLSITNLAIGGGCRGAVALLLLPATVLKARAESGLFQDEGIVRGLRHLWAREGISGLFKGGLPTVLRDAPFSGLYLSLFEAFKTHLRARGMGADASAMVGGLAAGTLASYITQPFDVIKTRVQVHEGHVSAWSILKELIQSPSALFRGSLPRVVRRASVAALNWTLFDKLIRAWHERH
ncbi:hypothetical protein PTSG_06414 [Salpingoeca rosetta]|uniref:Solute carrier family 25 member 38 n=1 Tax=Salpingoeca rosetta (strain ATCC 50818 / BSB-021) TaxID=946362 RepID=F2UBY8_SALR5|nr:uncharacterized protein PTSG_06414 [Salpingoeca rosetta]EGD74403.1 hypothetical protein PTSG_06414 [Salpingoeca rosetta]|eukprot:XP_004993303.1 hypothetical protein PTSG_06414 [Salpingoeca rosetta]